MAGLRAVDSNGQPVREMYDGTGIVSNAIGALGAKFKSWGREAAGLPPAEPVFDLSGPVNSFNAWDARMRNGEPAATVPPPPAAATIVKPAAAPATTTPAVPSIRTAAKPAVTASRGVRKAAVTPTTPTAAAAAPKTAAPMTPMLPGVDGEWLTSDKSGGYAEISGDPSSRIYAQKASPEAIAAAAAPVVTAERDSSLDPGSHGAWARNENARQLLAATGGARGLTALGAYDTAQLAPVAAGITAQGTLRKQLLENQGKLAEADLKGKYDNNGNLITANGVRDSATITGAFGNQRERIAGASREKVADITGTYDINGKLIESGSRIEAAKVTGGKSDIVPAAVQYQEEMKTFAKEQEQIDAARQLIGKDKDGSKKAALDAKETALQKRRKLLQTNVNK